MTYCEASGLNAQWIPLTVEPFCLQLLSSGAPLVKMAPQQTSRAASILPQRCSPRLPRILPLARSGPTHSGRPFSPFIGALFDLRLLFLATCTRGTYPPFSHQSDTLTLPLSAPSFRSLTWLGAVYSCARENSVPTIPTFTDLFTSRRASLSMW
jgi:hypothetical protein